MLLRRISNGKGEEGFAFCPDVWVLLDDDAPVPEAGSVMVSLVRWLDERKSLSRRSEGVGVWLAADGDVELLGERSAGLALISLQFPRFQDGRAYSQARLLRERYGYCGELRAKGNVLRDQLAFMVRCGFDSFDLSERINLADIKQALGEISVWYQPAGDDRSPAYQLRGSRKAANQYLKVAGGAL